jgi:hypothetical protein
MLLVISVTPTHPTYSLRFLIDNGILGATREDTILNLIAWQRRFTHSGQANLNGLLNYWQFPGQPPMSRIIEGTFPSNPYQALYGLQHFTPGCHASTDLTAALLRDANIPVQNLSQCGHSTPYFVSEHQYLSHGDDPYASFQENKTTVVPPPSAFLLDEPTFQSWFPTPDTGCTNIGRRDQELAFQYVPDVLVWMNCDDMSLGLSHADGTVFHALGQPYGGFYPLSVLEAGDLWGRLEQRTTALGGCSALCSGYLFNECAAGHQNCPGYVTGPANCPYAHP